MPGYLASRAAMTARTVRPGNLDPHLPLGQVKHQRGDDDGGHESRQMTPIASRMRAGVIGRSQRRTPTAW